MCCCRKPGWPGRVSFPARRLSWISQILAALKSSSFDSSASRWRARFERRAGSAMAHSRTWVSSRSRIGSQPMNSTQELVEFGGRERLLPAGFPGDETCGRPQFPGGLGGDDGETNQRPPCLSDYDVFTGECL